MPNLSGHYRGTNWKARKNNQRHQAVSTINSIKNALTGDDVLSTAVTDALARGDVLSDAVLSNAVTDALADENLTEVVQEVLTRSSVLTTAASTALETMATDAINDNGVLSGVVHHTLALPGSTLLSVAVSDFLSSSGSFGFSISQPRSNELWITAESGQTFPTDVVWIVKVVLDESSVVFLSHSTSTVSKLVYKDISAYSGLRVIVVAALPQDLLPSIKVFNIE